MSDIKDDFSSSADSAEINSEFKKIESEIESVVQVKLDNEANYQNIVDYLEDCLKKFGHIGQLRSKILEIKERVAAKDSSRKVVAGNYPVFLTNYTESDKLKPQEDGKITRILEGIAQSQKAVLILLKAINADNFQTDDETNKNLAQETNRPQKPAIIQVAQQNKGQIPQIVAEIRKIFEGFAAMGFEVITAQARNEDIETSQKQSPPQQELHESTKINQQEPVNSTADYLLPGSEEQKSHFFALTLPGSYNGNKNPLTMTSEEIMAAREAAREQTISGRNGNQTINNNTSYLVLGSASKVDLLTFYKHQLKVNFIPGESIKATSNAALSTEKDRPLTK
jgi:hypothetical protein